MRSQFYSSISFPSFTFRVFFRSWKILPEKKDRKKNYFSSLGIFDNSFYEEERDDLQLKKGKGWGGVSQGKKCKNEEEAGRRRLGENWTFKRRGKEVKE